MRASVLPEIYLSIFPPPKTSSANPRYLINSIQPRRAPQMGRPPGSRSAAACRALGDNVLSAPRNARKRGRTVVCRLSSHSASPRNVAHLLLLLSSSVLHTPGAPRPLSLHLFLVLPCSDAAPLVLLARLPRLSTVARPTPALLTACCALWRGCASASARRCPSQSPSDLEAASSTSVRTPRPFVLASPLHAPSRAPAIPRLHGTVTRHAPRSSSAPSTSPALEIRASSAPSPAPVAAPTAETSPELPS